MTVSLQRIDQIRKPDNFDDTLSAATISTIESTSVDHADFWTGVLSQLKRFLHGNDSGNWHDSPTSAFAKDASMKALAARTDLADKLALRLKYNLNDVTVGGSADFVLLTGTSKPDEVIAIANSNKGGVAAQLAGAVGANSLTENSGGNALKPRNLVYVFDGSTGDEIQSSGRVIYGLLQVGSSATDGNAYADSGNDAGQISFVRPNSTYDDLEACPAADIQGKTIIYAYTSRQDLDAWQDYDFRGDTHQADSAGTNISLDTAYDGGYFMTVDGNDVDIRLADTKAWAIWKGVAGAILWLLTRNDGGSDTLQIGAAVDLFDNDAADSNFAQGAAFDTTDQTINVGKTAVGVIDSSAIELRATTGAAEVSAPSGNVQFQTVRETTAIPLDDATAGKISALTGGPHASVSAAIKYALEHGGVDLSFKVFVAGSNYNQGVNIPAATLDLTSYSLDANTPANVDLFVFLNGRLLYGGNGTTKNDIYAGTTPANGDAMVDFPKGIKTGDVILSLGLKQ